MARVLAVTVLLVAFGCSGALASEPGQPLDCSDWVFLEPGHACTAEPITESTNPNLYRYGSDKITDNTGAMLVLNVYYPTSPNSTVTDNGPSARIELLRYSQGQQTVLAVIKDRDLGNGLIDKVRPTNSNNSDFLFESGNWIQNALSFDAVNGRLLIAMRRYCGDTNGPSQPDCPFAAVYGGGWLFMRLDGFTTLFEILQGYTPQPAALGFRVPYMPEGMAAADHFDSYWGNLSHPLDFTQAHPLACDYPVAAPHVGDHLTVTDTVPTPAPGQGVYYVTAATYQGATRYGRKTTAGQLSGRDPAVLPTCTAASDGGAIPIDAPTTITQPGSYILTRDIAGNDGPAITINASGVTLNLNGFQLERTGTGYEGAISGGGDAIEIYGGRIVGGGIGMLFSFCTIHDLTVRDAPGGVFLEGIHNTVEHTRHFSSHIWLDDAVGGIVRDNVLQSGFIVIESGDAFQVTHNAVTGGYIWLDGADNGVLLDNMVTGSATHGIYGLGWGNRFAGNVVSGCAGFGLYFERNDNPPGSTYSGNVLRGNHGTGCANPVGNAEFCDKGTGNESGGDNFMPDLR